MDRGIHKQMAAFEVCILELARKSQVSFLGNVGHFNDNQIMPKSILQAYLIPVHISR